MDWEKGLDIHAGVSERFDRAERKDSFMSEANGARESRKLGLLTIPLTGGSARCGDSGPWFTGQVPAVMDLSFFRWCRPQPFLSGKFQLESNAVAYACAALLVVASAWSLAAGRWRAVANSPTSIVE